MSIGAVICGRNDDWKDDERCLICLTSFIEEMDEVVYVDWNSPGDSLIDRLRNRLPKTGKLTSYIVPPEIAKLCIGHFPNFAVMCEVVAKNIGIRRIATDWIINTSIDIIAPVREKLTNLLVNEDTFYVVSRREIPSEIVYEYGLDRWKQCREYLEQVRGPYYFLDSAMGVDERYSMVNSCGDFQVAHRKIWHDIRGQEEGMVYNNGTDSNVQLKVVKHGFDLQLLFEPPVYHIEHTKQRRESVDDETKIDKDIKFVKYNNLHLWIEQFETTLNHRCWGCSDLDINKEII